MVVTVGTPRKSMNRVFQRVGVYGFGVGRNQKRCKYEIQDEDETMEMVQIGAERTNNELILMSDTGGRRWSQSFGRGDS